MVLWGIRSGLAVIHRCGEPNGVPKDGPAETRDDGIPYTARAAGEQNTHSTHMPGVTLRTIGNHSKPGAGKICFHDTRNGMSSSLLLQER